MHSKGFRRVLKTLSPRKYSPRRQRRADVELETNGLSETPPSPLTAPPVPVDEPPTAELNDGLITRAAEDIYQEYISRISMRAQLVNEDVPCSPSPAGDLDRARESDNDLENSELVDPVTLPDIYSPYSPNAMPIPNEFSSPLNSSVPDALALTDSPPPSPPCADRLMSRIHRHAVRGLSNVPDLSCDGSDKENGLTCSNAPVSPLTPLAQRNLDSVPAEDIQPPKEMDVETSSVEETRVPEVYTDANPAAYFSEFVPVGSGGSGSVYFARHNGSGKKVALKRVTPSTPSKRRALETEVRTMHAIQHENIVHCYAVYVNEPDVWIVMEAMDVGCLTTVLDFLRDRQFLLSEPHIAYILRETLSAVWAMHSRGCMHRDIKSDNLLVGSDGSVKLGDFEYSAVLTADSPKRRTVVGTAWWMAPETVRSSYYDYGADVWSIGILAIECAEWVPPLFGMESSKAMEVIRSGVTHQGFRRPDMWSVSFADFVRGCLTRDRSLRYTVPELLEHPFLQKACSKQQIANVFRAVKGMPALE